MSIRDFGALTQQWRDLEAAGIPLEPFENRVGIDGRSSGRVLTIRTGSHHPGRSEIRELGDGRFGYILSVFVRQDRPGKPASGTAGSRRRGMILSSGSRIRGTANILSGTPSPETHNQNCSRASR